MFRKYAKPALLAVATVLVGLLVIRCGGGGGGDSPPARVLTPISYTGVTTPVAISLANTPTLVANLLYGGASAPDMPSAVTISDSSATANNSPLGGDRLKDLFRPTLEETFGSAMHGYKIPAAVVYNNTPRYCESGYYILNGSIDDNTGLGTVTYDYYNCLRDGVTSDGMVHFSVYTNTLSEFNFTMDFVLMTMTSSEFNVTMSGLVRSDNSLYGNRLTERETMNYVERANITGKMYKYEDFVMTLITNDVYSPYLGGSISFSGVPVAIMYDSVHGHYSVETPAALEYSTTYRVHPDLGGQMLLTGDQSGIWLTVLSPRHVKIEIDLDGAAGYEVLRFVLWSELDSFTTLNLADSDGDGMHDSWESTYGLDPAVDDALLNLDGDVLNNLQEYEQGYEPNNAGSSP